jgi:hypothetical protein
MILQARQLQEQLCSAHPALHMPSEIWAPWVKGSSVYLPFSDLDGMWKYINAYRSGAQAKFNGMPLWMGRRKNKQEKTQTQPMSRILRALRACLPASTELLVEGVFKKIWLGDVLLVKRDSEGQLCLDEAALQRTPGYDHAKFMASMAASAPQPTS